MQKLPYVLALFERLGVVRVVELPRPGRRGRWVATNPTNARRLGLSVGGDGSVAWYWRGAGSRWSRFRFHSRLRGSLRWLYETTIPLHNGLTVRLGLDEAYTLGWTAKLLDGTGQELPILEHLQAELEQMAHVAAETKEAGPLSDWVEENRGVIGEEGSGPACLH